MIFYNFTATFIRCLGVIVVHSYIVGAKRTVVVGVCFPVGYYIIFIKPLVPSRFKDSGKKFIVGRVIPFRLLERHPVFGMIAHAQPETIGLYLIITRAIGFYRFVRNIRKQTTGRVSRNHVGINRSSEIVPMMIHAFLHAIPLFVIRFTVFTTY